MLSQNQSCGVRTLFLQCISLIYAIAFYSLYTQIPGLYGDNGLLPVSGQINPKLLHSNTISDVLWSNPTLLYFAPTLGLSVSQMMEVLCLVGTAIGLFMTVKPHYMNKLLFLVLWIFYLSLFKAGQTFLSFQWDILMLETGFLALILAPVLPGYNRTPLPQDSINLFLVRWLLFRMMFASGAVKLTSGCAAWWGLTAMPTHYFSQCIPTSLAWFASLLPDWMHRLSVASTFVIEIPLTFFFFAPTSSLRKFAFFHQNLLMIVIMLTGNYNFFNLLYMALCLSLADDTWIYGKPFQQTHLVTRCVCCLLHLGVYIGLGFSVAHYFGLKMTEEFTLDSNIEFTKKEFDIFLSHAVPVGVWLGIIGLVYSIFLAIKKSLDRSILRCLANLTTVIFYGGVAVFMFGTSLPSFTRPLDLATYESIPKSVKAWNAHFDQFELTSGYGLFRSMTGIGGRPEIVLEGSDDIHGPWQEYRFLYKPGDVSEPPGFCLPHQPRLDWQMWFAALGSYQNNPWFVSLVLRLLQGEQAVLHLLDPSTPFSNKPPKFIRARLYKYKFTSWGSEAWWTRQLEREYLPAVSLEDGLQEVLQQNGIIGHKSTPGVGLVSQLLSFLRSLSDGFPPHLQIWSFAWLALPLLKPMFVY